MDVVDDAVDVVYPNIISGYPSPESELEFKVVFIKFSLSFSSNLIVFSC